MGIQEIISLSTLALVFLWPLLYYVYIEDDVLNKDSEYFIISYINRHYISSFEIFLGLVIWFTCMLGLNIFNLNTIPFDSNRIAPTIVFVVIELIAREIYVQKRNRSLPMQYMFDVKDITSAIEMEPFHRLGSIYWESDHFIRFAHEFYPKNTILMYEAKSTKKQSKYLDLYILTVDGKKHKVTTIPASEQSEILHILTETLVYRKQFSKSEWEKIRYYYSGKTPYMNLIILKFLDYMKSSNSHKLMYDESLLLDIVNETKQIEESSIPKRQKKMTKILNELQLRSDQN